MTKYAKSWQDLQPQELSHDWAVYAVGLVLLFWAVILAVYM